MHHNIGRHNPEKMKFVLPVNRGVACADGRVFVGTLDGCLIALHAQTGKLLWSAEALSATSMCTITGEELAGSRLAALRGLSPKKEGSQPLASSFGQGYP